jgi:hypothetical protein
VANSFQAPSRVIVGLRANSMDGVAALTKWIRLASPRMPNLVISNVYRSDGQAQALGWLSELWLSLSYVSGPRHGETAKITWFDETVPQVESTLLAWEHEVILDPTQPLPHPLLVQKRIFLQTAAEVAGDFIHPVLEKSLVDLVNSDQRAFPGDFFCQGQRVLSD